MGGRGTGRHPVRLPRPTPRADPPPARAVARGGPLLGDAAHRGHRGDGAAVRTGGAPRDGGEPALPARSATTNGGTRGEQAHHPERAGRCRGAAAGRRPRGARRRDQPAPGRSPSAPGPHPRAAGRHHGRLAGVRSGERDGGGRRGADAAARHRPRPRPTGREDRGAAQRGGPRGDDTARARPRRPVRRRHPRHRPPGRPHRALAAHPVPCAGVHGRRLIRTAGEW